MSEGFSNTAGRDDLSDRSMASYWLLTREIQMADNCPRGPKSDLSLSTYAPPDPLKVASEATYIFLHQVT